MKFLKLAFVDHDPTTLWLLAWALSVLLYLALQAWFGIAWTGRWRKLALVPLIGVVLSTIFAVVVIRNTPDAWSPEWSSVLLFPLLGLVWFAPVGCIYEVVLGVVRLSVRRPAATGNVA